MSRMSRIAALDVGSNSVLMCIAEVSGPDDFRVIYDSARTTRLGEGLDRTGNLSPAAIRRTVEVLRECHRKAQLLGVGIAEAVATAAVREAENAHEFTDAAEEVLGIPVRPIEGREEARLTFLGVAGPGAAGPIVVVDVGGASTEITLARDGEIVRSESLPVGAARLKEAIPSEDILRFFVRVIEVIPADLHPEDVAGARVVLVGGTATTLAAIRLKMTRYDPDRVEGESFTIDEIRAMVASMQEMSVEERSCVPGLPASRAKIITSGGLVILQVLEDLGIDEATVSARGLRHGLLREITRGGR
ncbi:MAG: Ppx/GppA phosphatase family protein, partial [Planctomycetota bacterium]